MVVFVASVLMVLCISFLCSLLESSTLSLHRSDVAALRQKHAEMGELWDGLKKHIEQPIAVILILNTAANTMGAAIAGAEFSRLFGTRLGEKSILGFSIIFALLIIQWGEILPKTLGVRYRRSIATLAGRPLVFAIRLLAPFMWLTRTLNRPFEPRSRGEGLGTVDEIRALASYASFAHLIDRRQEKVITKSMELDSMTVARIMVPRTRVAALEESATISELLAMVTKTGFSRIPIYREEIDDIVGVLLVKDILIALNDGRLRSDEFGTQRVGDLMTDAVFLPETASVSDFMAKAAEKKTHMVLVVDEYGGFAGLMTLEDALEEMFGEIVDEHDRAERVTLEKLARNRWQVHGLCPVEDLSRAVGVNLVSKRGQYATVSGLLMQLAERVPRSGDVYRLETLSFRVIEAGPTLPTKIEVIRRTRPLN